MSIEHTFITADGHETRRLTKAKAIRMKCLDCSGWQPGEIVKCTCYDCALYPFRFGNEKGLDRKYVPKEQEEDIEDDEDEDDEEEIKPVKPVKKKIKTKKSGQEVSSNEDKSTKNSAKKRIIRRVNR
jgi:hypothetical protein